MEGEEREGGTYRERVFVDRAASSGDNVGRIEGPKHGGCLARVNDEQQLIVSDKKHNRSLLE